MVHQAQRSGYALPWTPDVDIAESYLDLLGPLCCDFRKFQMHTAWSTEEKYDIKEMQANPTHRGPGTWMRRRGDQMRTGHLRAG